MKLCYRYFGDVAILVRYERMKVTGDVLTIKCDAPEGSRVFLYSEKTKEAFAYALKDGVAEIPVERISGSMRVQFENAEGVPTYATPLEEVFVGDERYIVGGTFETREEIKRVQDALVYVGDLAKRALELAEGLLKLNERVEGLEKRANSGDIINF